MQSPLIDVNRIKQRTIPPITPSKPPLKATARQKSAVTIDPARAESGALRRAVASSFEDDSPRIGGFSGLEGGFFDCGEALALYALGARTSASS